MYFSFVSIWFGYNNQIQDFIKFLTARFVSTSTSICVKPPSLLGLLLPSSLLVPSTSLSSLSLLWSCVRLQLISLCPSHCSLEPQLDGDAGYHHQHHYHDPDFSCQLSYRHHYYLHPGFGLNFEVYVNFMFWPKFVFQNSPWLNLFLILGLPH